MKYLFAFLIVTSTIVSVMGCVVLLQFTHWPRIITVLIALFFGFIMGRITRVLISMVFEFFIRIPGGR